MVWLDSLRLRSRSPQMRCKAIESLTASSQLPGLKLVLAGLGDPDPEVRTAAARAVVLIKEELSVAEHSGPVANARSEAVSVLRTPVEPQAPPAPVPSLAPISPLPPQMSGLTDPDWRARLAAAQALEERADPAHVTQFLALLADEHFEVRLTAIQFLRRFPQPVVAQALIQRLADPDNDVRRAAALALGAIRDVAALEPLVLSLTDEEPAVRQSVAAALEEIDRRWIRSEAAQRAVPRLELMLKDQRPWIASAAQTVLDKLKAAKDKDTEIWKNEAGFAKD